MADITLDDIFGEPGSSGGGGGTGPSGDVEATSVTIKSDAPAVTFVEADTSNKTWSVFGSNGDLAVDQAGVGAHTTFLKSGGLACNGPIRALGDIYINEDKVYSPTNKPSLTDLGAYPASGGTVSGAMKVNGTITSFTQDTYRTVPDPGGIGSFWRNDGSHLYLMFTDKGEAESGGYNNLRPVYCNLNNGFVNFGHGIGSAGGVSLPADISITFNNGPDWQSGVGWGLQEESVTGNMILHRYNSGVWESAPFQFRNDKSFFCAGYGDFNDVHIRSDRRLKSDFVPITNALDKVCTLTGYSYNKKATLTSTETVREVGLIAQDVRAVLPEAVHTEGTDQILSISPAASIALLVQAVKELKAEVDTLKSKLYGN
ncbi:MAG: tail fiber domain-containing protein [Fusobacteriaceae bacterium]